MKNYLKPTAACQTKASNRKKIGIIGNISTNGRNIAYASGNLLKTINASIIPHYIKIKKYKKHIKNILFITYQFTINIIICVIYYSNTQYIYIII